MKISSRSYLKTSPLPRGAFSASLLKTLVIALCLLTIQLIPGPAATAAEPADPTKNYVGINNWFLNDYDGGNALVDIMMHARDWQNDAWSAPATRDADGWPTQDCSTVIFCNDDVELGTYKLVFSGQAATISMMWTGGSVTNKVYTSGTNTTTADVTLTNTSCGGLRFQGTKRLASDSPGTGIKNVRLYRPGYPTDGSVILTTRYQGVIGKFQVIRYMDWMDTNGNPIETWAQRRNPTQANPGNVTINGHTGPVGYPMELFVKICNQLNADMWINLPIFATDDYVTKTAQLMLYGSDGVNPYTSVQGSPVWPPLNSNLKVYVEYGNEIWNSAPGFQCYGWVKSQSDAIIGAPYTHPIEYEGVDVDQYTAVAYFSAWRLAEESKLFRAVFGDAAMMTRVRPVLMGQLGGNWFCPRNLPWLEGYYSTYRPGTDPFPNTDPKPVSHYIYGAGGSGYYGVNTWSCVPNTFFGAGNYPETNWWLSTGGDALWAKNYGLKRIAYEAGMGLDGGSCTDPEKLVLNADARMKTLTESYQNVWNQTGGDLIVYYCAVGPVNWEFTPDVDVWNSPKLQAIDNIRDNLTRGNVTLGQSVPGTAVVRDQRANNVYLSYAPSSTYDTTVGGEDCIVYKQSGEWAACALNTTTEGNYNISVRLATSAAINLIIKMNGVQIGSIPVASTGGSLVNSSTLLVPVYKGLNAVRITASGAGMTLRSATFTYVSSMNLQITTTTLTNADQYAAYTTTLAASAGSPPYTWSIASGTLPGGLALNSVTGTIAGTPTASGAFPFTAQVTDSLSATDTQALTLTVNAAPPLNLTTASLPGGSINQAYSQTLAATGGKPAYTWSIVAGSLPTGLSLHSTSGVISGTPTVLQTASFTAQVADSATPTPATDTAALSITIFQSPPSDPTNLVATAVASTAISLTWTDNATNETQFSIERSPNGTSTWTTFTVGPNFSSYLDTGLTTGNTYYYRVRAYNGIYSAYTSTVSATVTATGNIALFSQNFCSPPLPNPPWTTVVTGGANNPTLTVASCAMTVANLNSVSNTSGCTAYAQAVYNNSATNYHVLTGYFDINFSSLVFTLPAPNGQGTITLFSHWLSDGNNPTMRLDLNYSGYNDNYQLMTSNGIQYSGGSAQNYTTSVTALQTTNPRVRVEYATTYTNNGGLNWTVTTNWTYRNLANMAVLTTNTSTFTNNAVNSNWNPFTDANMQFRYGCVSHSTAAADDLHGTIVWEQVVSNAQTAGGGPGNFRFGQAAYTVDESSSVVQAVIPVWRVGGTDGAVGVSFATSPGTAVAGVDYTTNSGALSWANLEDAVKTISVSILSDPAVETAKTFNLTLSTPTGGATLGTPAAATVTINDWVSSGPPPSITVTVSGANLLLSFPTVTAKNYRLFKNTATPHAGDAGWTYDSQQTTGDGTTKSFTVAKPASGKIFYTVEYTQ